MTQVKIKTYKRVRTIYVIGDIALVTNPGSPNPP